jgi:hypothetical protein
MDVANFGEKRLEIDLTCVGIITLEIIQLAYFRVENFTCAETLR